MSNLRRRTSLFRALRAKILPLAIASGTLVFGASALLGRDDPATQRAMQPESVAPTLTEEIAPDTQVLRAAYSRPPAQWPAAEWDDSVAPADRHELGKVPEVVFPTDNPFSQDKHDLGWQLFYDPRLSGSSAIACVSCHHPDLGWADGKVTSQGHLLQPLDRNAPTLMGVAFNKRYMWDGRADSLEDQALLPLVSLKEMHGDFQDVEKVVNAIPEYRDEFKKAFGQEKITIPLIAKAISTFERTIVPGRSKFDSFLEGKGSALNDSELRGLNLFRTKARCINCHNGPLLTDGEFHNVVLTYYGRKFEDLGRYMQTHDPKDVGAFKTPTLRNIGRTAPYMHNGLFELEGLLNLYNAGMPNEKAPPGDPLAPHKSVILKKLNLTRDERSDLMDFLRDALEEPRLRVRTPKMPGMYGADETTQPTTTP